MARGRPPFVIDEAVLKKAETFAAQGLTQQQIADSLGIHIATLMRKKKEISELSEAIKRGEAKGLASITNALFQSARDGNVTAQIFYLKNRDPERWKDRRHIDETHRFKRPEAEIDETMTRQEAAESYAETLKRGRGENVVSINRGKR